MALRSRRSRRQKRGTFRLHAPRWVDPFPWIPGTEPEKRVFAALVNQLRIFFIFQGQVPEFESGGKMVTAKPVPYKPDFILPEYHLIIDPFGAYHHSRPEQAKRDAQKIATYNAAGYAYYTPWTGVAGTKPGEWVWNSQMDLLGSHRNEEIRKAFGLPPLRYQGADRKLTGVMNTIEMLLAIPEIHMGPRYQLTDLRDVQAKKTVGYRIGDNVGAGANSVAAANRARRKPKTLTIRSSR